MTGDETTDYVSITRLQRSYADAVNRRDWDAVKGLFAPDAVVTLDLVTREPIVLNGPDSFVEFVAPAVARFDFFEFVILNSHVELAGAGGSEASARLFMCELRRVAGEEGRDDVFGVYRDRYVRVSDGWLFADRRYRSLARFPAGDVFPLSTGELDS